MVKLCVCVCLLTVDMTTYATSLKYRSRDTPHDNHNRPFYFWYWQLVNRTLYLNAERWAGSLKNHLACMPGRGKQICKGIKIVKYLPDYTMFFSLHKVYTEPYRTSSMSCLPNISNAARNAVKARGPLLDNRSKKIRVWSNLFLSALISYLINSVKILFWCKISDTSSVGRCLTRKVQFTSLCTFCILLLIFCGSNCHSAIWSVGPLLNGCRRMSERPKRRS